MIDVGPIAEFEGTEWISFPLVRDMDNKMYERQRGPNLEIGSYAHRPILHEPDEIPRVGESEQASPTSFPFTPEDFSDRKSTRLNSSYVAISYAVFCLKKKKITKN